MKFSKLTRNVAILSTLVVTALICAGTALAAGGYTFFGDAQLVSPGNSSPTAAQIRSDPSIPPSYGGVDFAVPAGLTVAGLNNLATDYKFVAGTCGGGAPRFQINVTNGTNSGDIWAYIGPPPNYTGCPLGIWLNTGNLVAPANLVDASQILPGGQYTPWSGVQALFGTYQVTGIQVVTDSSWLVGVQTVHVDNVQINNATFTFEKPVPASKDQCKDGGWMGLGRADGSGFKNQGDCVSYVSNAK